MTGARSNRADVRNPVAADPEVAAIIGALSPEASEALRDCLKALSKKWREQAKHSWARHKAPMACYHKANAINARHLALAIAKTKATGSAASAAPRRQR